MRFVEAFEDRLRLLMRRAGLAAVPPSVAGGVVVLAVVALVWAGWRWWPREQAVDGFAPVAAAVEAQNDAGAAGGEATRGVSAEASASVLVHVVGAVRHPGVYELAAGSRAADAVQAAGGLMPDAAPEAVNLAREVTDGEQLAVPDRDAVKAGTVAGAGAPAGGGAESGAAGAGGQPGAAAVDLNSADAAALDSLPGVGPATAARIIADREANGPFASVEDLGRVSGIGPKKLEQLAGLVCVR